MPSDWSHEEVLAAVADYMSMLTEELRGREYKKSQHRRLLATQLRNRSDGSIERKHQNISAILISVGHPWISGYKPLGNYQRILSDVVLEWIGSDKELEASAERAATAPATAPQVRNILERLEEPPEQEEFKYRPFKERVPGQRVTLKNYFEIESRNRSLGQRGENLIVNFERSRLRVAGKQSLAERVEHISVTQGDGAGFDILSFEDNGTDRFIEVKTTSWGKQTPFLVSRNEVAVSRYRSERYYLFRVFNFRDDPRFYFIKGSIEERCVLDPTEFLGRPRSTGG
jgi:hypothetical protein